MGIFLSTLSADTAGQLDILWHDGHALGMNCAKVGVLEQSYKISLGCLELSLSIPDCGSS